jgi:hypothetical protein
MIRLSLSLICAFCTLPAFNLFARDKLTTTATKTDAKIYTLQALDGKEVKVKILADYTHHALIISCLKDSINIADYWGVPPAATFLGKNFLQIKYEVRGGSNLGLGNVLLVCVSDNRLHEALHVQQYCDWESGDLMKKYSVDFSLGWRGKDYVLTGHVTDKAASRDEAAKNYAYTNSTDLQFDDKLKVFYSIKDNLADTLKVCYPNLMYRREILGNFPKVLLGKAQYFFIGGQWFEADKSTLIKY